MLLSFHHSWKEITSVYTANEKSVVMKSDIVANYP